MMSLFVYNDSKSYRPILFISKKNIITLLFLFSVFYFRFLKL